MTKRTISKLELPPDRQILLTGDLHLQYPDEQNSRLFLQFLTQAASKDRVLVLLGDLFYYYFENARKRVERFEWLIGSLKDARDNWDNIILMRGNRDYLLGTTKLFPPELTVAGDFLEVTSRDRRILVSHGDLFLKGDPLYFAFRRFMRSTPSKFFTRNIAPSIGVKLADGLRWISFRKNRHRGFTPPNFDKIRRYAQMHRGDSVVFGHFHKVLTPSSFPSPEPECWCIGSWEEDYRPVLVFADGEFHLVDVKCIMTGKE